MTKSLLIKLNDIESLQGLEFQICKKLKLRGWQFDKLLLQEKILKYTSRNPDKRIVIQVDEESIVKRIRKSKLNTLYSNNEFPPNFEMGNPFNRWIGDNPVIRTREQAEEDNRKVEFEAKVEFGEIQATLEILRQNCNVEVVSQKEMQ